MSDYRMDGHKLYWHLDRVAAVQRGEMIAPIYVEVSPTDRCTHNCIFCGLDFKRETGFSLDTEAMLARIVEMGKLGVRSMNFSGEGEPLLHSGTPAFVEACAKAGIDSSLTTNGSVNGCEAWEIMLRHLTWTRFSVDAGTGETHALVHRGGANDFKRTLGTIRQAVQIRNHLNSKATIGVQFVLLQQNFRDLEIAIRLFQDTGVDYLSIKPFSKHPQMEGGIGDPLTTAQAAEAAMLVKKLRSLSTMKLIFRERAFCTSTGNRASYTACRALPYWAYVSSNGDVYTCFTFLDDNRFLLGNIGEQNMNELFMGDKRRESIRIGREELSIEGDCRLNCRMARINEFLEMVDNPPEHVNFI